VKPEQSPSHSAYAADRDTPLQGGRHRHRAGRVERPPNANRDGLLYCVKVFVVTRIALAVIALVAVALLPDFSGVEEDTRAALPLVPTPVSVPGWPARGVTPGWHNLFTVWERQDALWYLRIADQGYATDDASAAFFPLYPLVVRGVSFVLGGHPLAAGLLVSNAAFLGALLVMWALTRSELSEELARRAVLYAAVFPTAFFFVAPYSESLFLLLVVTAFWAARRSRWELAGVAGALAALTRNLGVVLFLPLALEAVYQSLSSQPRRWQVRALAWSLAPVAGTLAYLGFWGVRSGDWLAPLHQQAAWQRSLTIPLATLWNGTRDAYRYVGLYPGGYHLLDWLITVAVLAAAGYALVRFRPSYAAFAWAAIIVPLASQFASRPLIAFSRYALPIFPVYWAFARWTTDRPVRHELLLGISAALLGLMTLLFVNWYYII
jgi:hypothetical protein